ncbi:hypothetical protein CALCODRAFT_520611 [Calocera cornea HHB12733]|uniref:Uncharacterized protein n=1 Tax=Calocera cornea HHB12733 TaxID=1353952 RepID=A0A165DDV6_9BASI|nr:hypothetical protein CALCODRAFT_520611 [Calocera cornea HHB12733]
MSPTPSQAFLAYPFALDAEFQAGLQSILSTAPPTADRAALEHQARRFYFSRKTGLALSHSDLSAPPPAPAPPAAAATHCPSRPRIQVDSDPQANEAHEAAPPSAGDAPYPLTFAQLAELIQTNRTHLIPNNDVVPSTVLEGQASESILPAPRKPWETTASPPSNPAPAPDPAAIQASAGDPASLQDTA